MFFFILHIFYIKLDDTLLKEFKNTPINFTLQHRRRNII